MKMADDWREVALNAREKLQEQDNVLKILMSPPFECATVVQKNGKTVDVVCDNGKIYEVNFHPKLEKKLTTGTVVHLNPRSMAIVGLKQNARKDIGELTIVEDVFEDNRAQVNIHGTEKVVSTEGLEVKKGDRVVVDPSYRILLSNLGKESNQYHLDRVPDVPWSRVGGLDHVIKEIKQAVEIPYMYRELFAKYNKRVPKGVLLYGPPGCGKTLVAKATAHSLSQRIKAQTGSDKNGYFINIKGPEILNKYVGNSEERIREIFARARERVQETDEPVVVFIDEAESILRKRGSSISSDVYDSIVPQFLAEMDGMDDSSGVVLILATNRADRIDPAVIRDGRIDKKIRIGRPNYDAARKIFNIYLKGMPMNGSKVRDLVTHSAKELFRDANRLYEVDLQDGTTAFLCYRDFTSGAMIENIVQSAATRAMNREIEGKKGGITKDDLELSIHQTFEEGRELLEVNPEDLEAALKDRASMVTAIRPYKA